MKLKKKKILIIISSIITGSLIIWGCVILFTPDSKDLVTQDQINIINKVIVAIEQFGNDADATTTVNQLDVLTAEYAKTLKRMQKVDGDTATTELDEELNSLSGKLINESINIEISEKDGASDVSKSLDKFMQQN